MERDSNKRVLFFNHETAADYDFGKGHPMKVFLNCMLSQVDFSLALQPQRMRMLTSLNRHYGLYQLMDFFVRSICLFLLSA